MLSSFPQAKMLHKGIVLDNVFVKCDVARLAALVVIRGSGARS